MPGPAGSLRPPSLATFLGAVLLTVSQHAVAGSWLDAIRDYDLNDYALGLAVLVRQSPYIGGENSAIAYPYLTSFRHSSMTKDWLLIRDGGYGFRWVSDSEWELGALGRVSTLGLGNSDASELDGVADRKWAIELGPTLGYRNWPVHINWTHWQDVSNRHGGYQDTIAFSYPVAFERGYLVPSIEAVYDSKQRNDYYYSVRPAEITPTRPEYEAGASWGMAAEVRLGYELTPRWLLSTTFGVEWLDEEVTDSPIVGRDHILYGSVGLAYNANVFNPTAFDNYGRRLPAVDLRVGAFFAGISSKLTRDPSGGATGVQVNVEDMLDVPEDETALEAEIAWRIGTHHRFELGYFELARHATSTLESDLEFGDAQFPAGTTVDSRIDYGSLRLGYTFYLVKDNQKELGVMGGIHLTEFDTVVRADGSSQRERSRSSTPLPVIGLKGAVYIGDKTALNARLHLFRTDFDQHEGTLNYVALDLERRIGKQTRVGIGYNFYGVRLASRDDDLHGEFDIRHHGPVLFLTVGFQGPDRRP